MSKAADAFDLHFERRPQYLYASLACRTLNPSIALEILGEIMGHAADNRCKLVMVQCDLASIEHDSHLLEAMLALATMRSGTRVAFVDCRDSTHPHPAIGDDFKLFDDAKEAEEWLLAAQPDAAEV
jgi:hypothetical protein